jgi:hypothetical protein
MSTELTLHRVPFIHIYRDLSFRDFFQRYDPWRDGKVIAATYSFGHKEFTFWATLRPESTIYVDQKYEPAATEFVKRYPWFEVRAVPHLHSKAVFFEQSGVLLVGSENLYAPTSCFSEVMLETSVPENERAPVRQLLFGGLGGRLCLCRYGVKDIRLHGEGIHEGTPFVPSNIEVDHWDLISNTLAFGPQGLTSPDPELHNPGRLYAVFEYEIGAAKRYLAMDRGYGYCGDLDEDAFSWLCENCIIETVHERYEGGHFPSYHPVPLQCLPSRAIWFGGVRDRGKHDAIKVAVPQVDITRRKVRRKDSLTAD